MKKSQITVNPYVGYREIADMMAKRGFKPLAFGSRRVPSGTVEKAVINVRRWCGEWAGYQTFRGVYVFYK